MEAPALMDIGETAEYLKARGVDVTVSTLRDWRRTWPEGQRRGPRPRLITTRKLRYARDDCDSFIAAAVDGPIPSLTAGTC